MQESDKDADENKKDVGKADAQDAQSNDEVAAHKIILERIEARKKELEDIEARVAKRNDEFKQLLEETKLEGRAIKGKEESADDEAKKAALKLIAGTGLEKRIRL